MTLLLALSLIAAAPSRPAPSSVATLCVGAGGVGRPRPFACGLLPGGGPGREDVVGWWRDAAGHDLPVVLHRRRDRRLVHGVHPDPGRATLALGARGRPRAWPLLSVRPDGAGWRVEGAGRPLALAADGTVVVDGWRVEARPGFRRGGAWTLVHRCPLRTDLVYDGALRGALAGTDAALRVTVHAGVPHVACDLHLRSRVARSLVAGCGLSLSRRDGAHGSLRARVGEGWLAPGKEARRTERGWWSGRDALGEGAGCLLECGRSRLGVAPAAGPRPGLRRVAVRVDGATLDLDAGARLAAGEGRLWRWTLVPGGVADGVEEPLLVPARPARRLHGRRLRLAPAPEDDPLERVARAEVARFLGDRGAGLLRDRPDAGDWIHGREDLGNCEFDTTAGLLGFAVRHRRVAALTAARAAADHLVGFDRDACGTGLFHPHGAGHRAALTEPGHHWIDGLVLLAAWLDDPLLAREVDRIQEDQLEHFERRELDRLRPRSLGWGLRALTWARRARRPEPHLAELRRWRRHLEARQTEQGLLRLSRAAADSGSVAASPMVQGGIVLPALVESLDVDPSASARRAARLLARGLVRHALSRDRDRRPRLAAVLHLAGREFEVVARAGRAGGEEAALFLSGLACADPALLRRPLARALRHALPAALAGPQRRHPGKDLSLLLAALPGLGCAPE